MTGPERLDEHPIRAACLMDVDCTRYSMCQLANGCRCQVWGECVLVRVAGQPCHTDSQCDTGLMCSDSPSGSRKRCVPYTHLEDLSRFADQPEPDLGGGAPPDIPATYGGPMLVATISLSLVVLCLAIAAWFRVTTPPTTPQVDAQVPTSSSVLISMNHLQPLPNYDSTHLYNEPHHSRDQ